MEFRSYYNMYPVCGAGAGGLMTAVAGTTFYPYLHQFGEGTGGATGYSSPQGYSSLQHPHHLFQYSTGTYPHHYAHAAPMSLPPTPPPLQSGVTMALHAPPIPHR
ncbi:hypothetical protein REPUB_Repub07fG0199800 [Reevesia pubescens]